MTTATLALLVRHELDLELPTRLAVANWIASSLWPQLRRLWEAAPEPLYTAMVSLMLRRRFELDLTTPDGLNVAETHGDDAHWRIAVAWAKGSLDELRAVLTPGQLAVRAAAGCTPDE